MGIIYEDRIFTTGYLNTFSIDQFYCKMDIQWGHFLQRSTMGKKNVVNYPSEKQAYQFKLIQSTGMATQMQLKVLLGKKSHGRTDF